MRSQRILKIGVVIVVLCFLFKICEFGLTWYSLKDYNSESIYVYNLTKNEEVLSINSDDERPPASLTKIMAVYVGLNHIKDINAYVKIDDGENKNISSSNEGNLGLKKGDEVTYKDILYGTMISSGNEFANTLAVDVGGGLDKFISMMNDTANELGMDGTNFETVTGIDTKDQYTTAKDIEILIKNGLKNPEFRSIFTKKRYEIKPNKLNQNSIVIKSPVLDGFNNLDTSGFKVIGGTTATSDDSGLCLATLCEKNGDEYIVVVMGAPFDDTKNTGDGQFKDTVKIMKEIK